MNLEKILENHKLWLEGNPKGEKANLRDAHLRDANLTGANLDFSCLPLWCGGQFKTDERVCKQLVAHTLRIMEVSDEGSPELLKLMTEYKTGWHREDEFK